jgi:hypothetical protein
VQCGCQVQNDLQLQLEQKQLCQWEKQWHYLHIVVQMAAAQKDLHPWLWLGIVPHTALMPLASLKRDSSSSSWWENIFCFSEQ